MNIAIIGGHHRHSHYTVSGNTMCQLLSAARHDIDRLRMCKGCWSLLPAADVVACTHRCDTALTINNI